MDLSTYLEGLLQKRSVPQTELAHFLKEMRKTPSGPLITSKLLASKIQSSSETHAMRSFDILEAALNLETEGSIEFRTEVGRYRFLNELIRILSPKFYGTQTIPAVKERAIKFLTDAAGSKRRKWFPSEHSKINAVYNSLVEGGVILPNAEDPDAEFHKSIFERGENAILLKRLLQSKDPSDLQAANRLIKSLVDEEAKRNERRSEIHSLIDRIETSTTLLTEMCSQSQIDGEIVDDLASSCKNLRNRLGEIGTETNEETCSLLQASENIERALAFYEQRKTEVVSQTTITSPEPDSQALNLIEHPILQHTKEANVPKLSLADELLIGMDLGPVSGKASGINNGAEGNNTTDAGSNLLNFDIDLDVGQMKDSMGIGLVGTNSNRKPGAALEELGLINRQLMEEGLMGRETNVKLFAGEVKSNSQKITLSQLQKQSAPTTQSISTTRSTVTSSSVPFPVPGISASPASHISLLDLEFLEKSCSTKMSSKPNDDNINPLPNPIVEDDKILLLNDTDSQLEGGNCLDITGITEQLMHKTGLDDGFSLDKIQDVDLENIEILDDVTPLSIPLDSISDSGKELIDLSFTFGTFPGFPHSVKASVITVTNRNPMASISDYSFQLLPPKGFQVKLFPPSSTELNPWKKRFLSPPLLTQVALILSPPSQGNHLNRKLSKEIKLKFILTCYIGEETALFNSEFVLPSF